MKTRSLTPLMMALLSTTLFMGTPAQATVPTSDQIQTLVTQGQAYLLSDYVADSGTSGHWAASSGYELPVTCSTVAALLETGKYSDPLYKTDIDNAITYIRSFVKTDTLNSVTYHGIYQDSGDANYDNGLALLALSLYGQQTTFATPALQTAYNTDVSNALQFFVAGQSSTGISTGGWRYTFPSTDADMSVTQFGAMGMYYGSHYLNVTIDPSVAGSWSNKLYTFLQHDQDTTDTSNPALFGHFYYTPNGSDGTPLAMSGAGLWSLAMIGKGGGTEANNAVGWFAANYNSLLGDTWQSSGSNNYYMVYAVAKGLTATLGVSTKLGGSIVWADGLTTAMYNQASTSGTLTHWVDQYDLSYVDPNSNMSTAFVLMSLAFADINLGTTDKFLPDPAPVTGVTAPPLSGMVTLETRGGTTISVAGRANAGENGTVPATVTLPLGSFGFTLNLPTTTPATTSVVLTLVPPASAFDPANPNSFVNADGTVKAGINWFKVVGGTWKGTSVPITVDLVNKVITVTLTDGLVGVDADGIVNGKIVDPGAPGFGAAPANASTSGNSSWFGCSVGHNNGTPDPMLPLMAAGALAYLIRRKV